MNIICAWNVVHLLLLWGRNFVVSLTVSAEVDCRIWGVAGFRLDVFRARTVHRQGLTEGVGKRQELREAENSEFLQNSKPVFLYQEFVVQLVFKYVIVVCFILLSPLTCN